MLTNKAIAELGNWVIASSDGDIGSAQAHLREFYHIGNSLVASGEFQGHWHQKQHVRLEPEHIELVCKVLAAIAEVEAAQVGKFGKALKWQASTGKALS